MNSVGVAMIFCFASAQYIDAEFYPSTFSGDDADDGSFDSQTKPQRSERSHMIIWQSPSPSLPSSAL